jgi:hypothetical protein
MKKKFLSVTLAALFIFAAAGCGTSVTPPAPAEPFPPPPANVPAVIQYDFVEGGTYIFINDPESITRENLADGPRKQSMFTGTFTGETTIFFPHGNDTHHDPQGGIPIYYGVYFYNDRNRAATLTLLNNGGSVGWIKHCEDWRRYYEFSGTGTRIRIPANSGRWLFMVKAEGDEDDSWGGPRSFTTTFDPAACQIPTLPFNGLMKVDSAAELEVRLFAFQNPAFANSSAAVLRDTIFYDNTEGTTGWSPYKAEVTGHFSWTIDDSTTAGRLPVSVNGNVTDRWSTHTTQISNESTRSCSLPFTILHNGEPHVQAYGQIDPRSGRVWDWANWGVIYKNTFSITNNGSQPRVVAYCIAPYGVNQFISTYSPLTGYKDLPFSDVNNWLNGTQTVIEVIIQPRETKEIPVEIVLGGGSYWNVTQYLTVRDNIALVDDERVLISHKIWTVLEGYGSVEPYTVTVRNTSGLDMTGQDIVLTGTNTDAFTVSKTAVTALTPGGSDEFTVKPADGLPAGVYRAALNISGTVFDLYFSVQNPDVHDFLTLIPSDLWSDGNDVSGSRVQVSNGEVNSDGVPALVFTNTAGYWPYAAGFVEWGSGIEIPRSWWPYVYLEYDITVEKNANFTLVSGKNDRTHMIPLPWSLNEYNELNSGSINGVYDMLPGRYKGRVPLSVLIGNRRTVNEAMEDINLNTMFPLLEFTMDGWRVFSIGESPAAVTVSYFKFVVDRDAIP